LKLECVSPVSVMCITAKAIFMVDFDDFGWLFMVDFGWFVHDFLLDVHGRFWLVVPDFVGCSWPAERDEEGERKKY
jgi:hypothetical protein